MGGKVSGPIHLKMRGYKCMSDDKEPPEKVKIEVYETDMITGTIRRNYTVELQSNKHDALKLKEEAMGMINKLKPKPKTEKDKSNESYMY